MFGFKEKISMRNNHVSLLVAAALSLSAAFSGPAAQAAGTNNMGVINVNSLILNARAQQTFSEYGTSSA